MQHLGAYTLFSENFPAFDKITTHPLYASKFWQEAEIEVDKNGTVRIVENGTDVDLSGIEAELATKANAESVAELKTQIATKVGAAEVDVKINTAVTDSVATAKSYTDGKIESAINEHMAKKYEITDVPIGTLVDYGDKEIRIMCPHDAEYHLQSVGSGGDANTYYITLKTYVYDDNIIGYKEHLGNQVDAEILTDFKTDKYGRRYQPTWLGVAKYDDAAGVWSYYGKNSTSEKFIGWDYQIDFFDANGVMIASDCVRVNLSNEECHSSIKPFYGVSEMTEIEGKVEEVVEEKMADKIDEVITASNAYTDAKIAEIAEASSYEIIEF